MKCSVYETGFLQQYKYVVVLARYGGRWIFCNHRARESWEMPGGHIEPNETPEDAAGRELYEETGAVDFTLKPICDYWACDEPHETTQITWANGRFFFASVSGLGPLPDSEIARIDFFDQLPEDLTYPDIARTLFAYALDYYGSN